MALRRLRSAALPVAAAVALSVGAAGCAEKGADKQPAREGISVRIAGLDYNVFITRQLNPRDAEDRDYYRGPEPRPGYALFGVFLQVCNVAESGPAKKAAEHFEVVDTLGNRFEPVELPEDNVFAYRPRELSAKACIPEEGSIASSSPTAGSLLLFELPTQATENRPLELEVEGPLGGEAQGRTSAAIELDI